jgi:acetylornithine/succinyldiaminopimelate/putrescine aminotransferase
MDPSDILRRGFDEYARFVNPFIAERARLANEPVKLVRVADGTPWLADGHAIEDLHGVAAFGQRHPAVDRALQAFLESDAPTWFPARVNPWAGRLARLLCERTGYENVFLGCTGSDAVEAAIKLARAVTRRPRLLGLAGAYHGCTMGSCALMSPGVFRDPFGPHLPGAEHLPFGDVDALRKALEAGDVAAVIVEPVQGEGGVRPLPAEYVEALCALTQEHGALLVADEVQTGLGRAGAGILRSARWPRRPDVALLGKALGGGIVPISAMLTSNELFARAYGRDFATAEAHNTTFQGNVLGCVAAIATLEEILTDALFANAREMGALLKGMLHEALSGNPLYDHVRGEGLMLGIALRPLDHPWLSFSHFGYPELEGEPITAPLFCHRMYERGFFAFACGHDFRVVRVQPRLDVDRALIERFVTACADELRTLSELAA